MTNKTDDIFPRLTSGIRQGLIKGWKGLVWLIKIIIPISFATALLVHFGIIYKLDFLLTPVMTWLSLPPSAALVLIAGIFTGIYGTVAALSVMPFSMPHMILMAVFTLISHNLIQESIVQGKSGISPYFAAVFRLAMAFLVTFICSKILGVTPEFGESAAMGKTVMTIEPFGEMLTSWGSGTIQLMIKIFCIIMPLMVILELAKTFHVIPIVTRIVSPVLSLMGLDYSTGMLWLTASIFGLAYGSAVIVEQTQTHVYKKEDLNRLHLSIGINHAMIEDPVLFLPLGLPAFWLWVPRLIAAMAAVWLYWGFFVARRGYAKRAGYKKLCDH